QDERPRAGLERLAGEVLAARLDRLARDHHPGAVDQDRQQRRERRLQVEDDRHRVLDLDVVDRRELARARRALGRPVAVDVPLDRVGVEVGAVVELDAFAQLERDLLAVAGDLPALGEAGDDLAVGVDLHERVVDLVVGVAVDERARAHRVEVDDVVLEHEGDRAARRSWRGGGGRGRGAAGGRRGGGTRGRRRGGRGWLGRLGGLGGRRRRRRGGGRSGAAAGGEQEGAEPAERPNEGTPRHGPSRHRLSSRDGRFNTSRADVCQTGKIRLMEPYEFRLPAVLRVGVGAHRLIPAEVSRLGARRLLVVSDGNCARIPEVGALVEELRRRVAALGRLGSDALVLGVGGGAVLDTAKAVAALATNGGRIADYMGRDKLARPRLPLVLAPTTAGTGSEATRYTVITEPTTDVKMLITDWKLLPDAAVVDPLLVVGSPPPVTASSGVDALTHAIEAYVSQRRQPTADLFALGAIRQLYPALLAAFRDGADLAARTSTLLGALHAGIAFCNSSVALVHGKSRPIGAHFHVAHGLSNSMLLPTITAWSLPAAPDRYRDLAVAMGLGSEQ